MNYCPLCSDEACTESSLQDFYSDKKRTYLCCSCCGLISVSDEYLLSESDEKAQYDFHLNDPDDPDYQNFLSRTTTPLFSKLGEAAIGLDFGCGSGPAICKMAEDYAIKVHNYDLYYYNQPKLLEEQYDFVIMTEVIEHIADPQELLELLDSLLKPKAILAIMTKRVLNLEQFKTWHYKNDPTHIRFYAIETFQWIARSFNWHLEIIDKDVIFFYKQ